jgi:thiopurine S-methyltransferase
MEPDFWHDRWNTDQIGFHQPRPNEKLTAHWPSLEAPAASAVFVPLCGKSLDMVWLAKRGHRIVGVELSELAVDDFFAGQNLTPETRQVGSLTLKSAGPFELYCGDYFDISPDLVEDARAIYDRAALVALPAHMRRAYAAHTNSLFAAAPAPIFLITLEYDQSIVDGPPHSVPRTEVEELFGAGYDIHERHRAEDRSPPPKFVDAGLHSVTEVAYLLEPRAQVVEGGTD